MKEGIWRRDKTFYGSEWFPNIDLKEGFYPIEILAKETKEKEKTTVEFNLKKFQRIEKQTKNKGVIFMDDISKQKAARE